MTTSTFDTLGYTKGAEKIGMKREHAEYQAEQMAKIINDEMVTKSFLSQKIAEIEMKMKELEMKIIIKVGAMMVVQSGLILTVIGFLMKH